MRSEGGVIGHGLVGTRLSCVNRVLFEKKIGRGYLKTCTCVVERDDDRRSIKENPTVQTYDPWGLGSGQSKCMIQIARVAEGWGVHRPRFSGHTAFVSEPCAL